YITLFKRYSYLKECPIVPTNPENLTDNLRMLIKNPALRNELGKKGRQYVEKYHSKITAQLMFSRIYEKIWHGNEIDLINYFHPLLGQYYKDYEEYITKTKVSNDFSQAR
ncbi:MAG TPA: protein adenylyltransferase SelO family protein, partial [Chitinophagales bacterium]|nr:protein adenylyltransferase SelO family protein [Chitinophagales bacterium]